MWPGLMPFLGVFRCRSFSHIARNAISYAFCLVNNHHIVYFPLRYPRLSLSVSHVTLAITVAGHSIPRSSPCLPRRGPP